MDVASPSLAGLRVLVLEDEMLVSLMIEDLLDDQGCHIVGPYDRLLPALDAARIQAIDFALLDVNVAGSNAFSVAEALAARNIPFLFLSGYGQGAMPVEHSDWRVCDKPFRAEALVAMIAERVRLGTTR
jgi:DNA-binding response OmpR family regulator